MKKRRRTFRVTLDIPPGVTVEEARLYVLDAVSVWAKSTDPDEPLFDLDGDSVRVSVVPRPRPPAGDS